MKKHDFITMALALFLIFLAGSVALAAQKKSTFDKDWIRFNYPGDCTVKEERVPGKYDRVTVTSTDGCSWTITVFRKQGKPDALLAVLMDEYRSVYEKMGGSDIKVDKNTGGNNFGIIYTLKDIKYKNSTSGYREEPTREFTTNQYPLDKERSGMLSLMIDIQENGLLYLKGGDIFEAIQFNDTKGAKALVEKNPSLLKSRANIGRESDITPLHLAASLGNVELVSYFLEKGIDAGIADAHGITPLHNVAVHELDENSKAIIEILLKHGADINAGTRMVTSMGSTPLDFALSCNKKKMADFLISKGAKKGSGNGSKTDSR